MKAFKFFSTSAVLASGLINQVYASTPPYVKSFSLNAPESGIKTFFKGVYYIIMFALILAAAYYATKFLAKKGLGQNKTKNMKLLESMPLGADRSLHIVKVGTQYFLIGTASKNMFLISELQEDKLMVTQDANSFNMDGIEIESYEDNFEARDFGAYLDGMKQNLSKLKSVVRGKKDNE
jgi:flagellar protein FliO/FliZ